MKCLQETYPFPSIRNSMFWGPGQMDDRQMVRSLNWSSNITLGFPSLSILKLLKAEKCRKVLERNHLLPMEKKYMHEYTIIFIYGLISLLIQEIFAYIYIIFPIKDFGKMQRKVNLLFILSWLSPFHRESSICSNWTQKYHPTHFQASWIWQDSKYCLYSGCLQKISGYRSPF